MTSTIRRLNQDNFIDYFVHVADIEREPIREVSIQSDEVNGKKFEYKKFSELQEKLSLFMAALSGFTLGMLFVVLYILLKTFVLH